MKQFLSILNNCLFVHYKIKKIHGLLWVFIFIYQKAIKMYKKWNICTERLYKLQYLRHNMLQLINNVNVFTTKKSLKKYIISTKFYMSNNYAQLL